MGQPLLASITSSELEEYVEAKFYSSYALANGIYRIKIREKMLEFSSLVLPMLSPYQSE